MTTYTPASGFSKDRTPTKYLLVSGVNVVTDQGEMLWSELPESGVRQVIGVGELDDEWVAVVDCEKAVFDESVMPAREFLGNSNTAMTALYSHSVQILRSFKDHQYCGRCGSSCAPAAGEWAMTCNACEMRYYPRISPCVIVLIKKGDEILLVQHQRHLRNTAIHTVIAGFVEPGESVEEAVIREVKEEVGIDVKDLRYLCSQSWPFPHALMLAFEVEYAGGDLELEEEEIASASWFHRDALPEIPPKFTISRRMIDNWLNEQ